MKVQINKSNRPNPISKLVWLGKKGAFTSSRIAEMESLKSFFPDFQLEQFEVSGSNEKELSKKVGLHFLKWADNAQLSQLGLFCNEPVGFPNWKTYIDFIRKDPPALLWRTHPYNKLEINKILVPIDFSSGTERVLSFLSKTFEQIGGKEITLLNLFNKKAESTSQTSVLREEKIEAMKWFIEANVPLAIRRRLVLDAQPKLNVDKAETLDNYIQSNDIDLVILGSHNFNHYHYLLYGSMTEEVLSKSLPVQVCVLFK